MTRDKLLAGLSDPGSESERAARALADAGDRTALPRISRSILNDCSFETISDIKIGAS